MSSVLSLIHLKLKHDVPATSADVSDLVNDLNYKPNTTIQFGIDMFIDWYMEYFK